MDIGRVVGCPYPVEWVTVDEPDHDDDTDNRRDRVPGFTPTASRRRTRAPRSSTAWKACGPGARRRRKIYFDCTDGRPADLGQVWEYDPGRETITLSTSRPTRRRSQNPDNVVIVPQTGDIFLQEDGTGEQFIRGVTRDGEIYDFAKTGSERHRVLRRLLRPGRPDALRQPAGRPRQPAGRARPDGQAVTYAIYGPFEKRAGANDKNFATGPAR